MKKLSIIAIFLLFSCKFQPLNQTINDQTYNGLLAQIKLGKIEADHSFFLIKNLESQLNPQGLEVPKKYLLNLKVTSSIQDLLVKKDSTISRQEIKSYSSYEIIDLSESHKKIDSGNFTTALSYPTSGSIYSSYINEEYTLKNSFKEIARNIKLRAIIALTKKLSDEDSSQRD